MGWGVVGGLAIDPADPESTQVTMWRIQVR